MLFLQVLLHVQVLIRSCTFILHVQLKKKIIYGHEQTKDHRFKPLDSQPMDGIPSLYPGPIITSCYQNRG